MKLYQIFRRVGFEITTDNQVLSPPNISPLLKEFRERLEQFTVADGSFRLWVECVDDFQYYFITPTRLKGSYRLNIEARDSQDNEASERYNSFMVSKLNHHLAGLGFQKDGMFLEVKN